MSGQHLEVTHRIGRLRTSNYDVSNTCNLTCEGCLYFSGAGAEINQAETDVKKWQDFFNAEARRGITFAYLAGAEPSLYPERIAACHSVIPYGVIFTNGIKRIDPAISYRIHVSLWGNNEKSALYRGGKANLKAMRNYEGDPRAVFVLTLNALNLDEVSEVAQACSDYGLKLTFSLFSPTVEYERNLERASATATRNKYFRFSSENLDMRFNAQTLSAVRQAMRHAKERFPQTVGIPDSFLNWVTQPESLYQLDEAGIAIDCGNRLTKYHRHFNADLTRTSGKCCSPNIDCKSCRAYAMSYATYFSRRKELLSEWDTVWQFWQDYFLPVK